MSKPSPALEWTCSIAFMRANGVGQPYTKDLHVIKIPHEKISAVHPFHNVLAGLPTHIRGTWIDVKLERPETMREDGSVGHKPQTISRARRMSAVEPFLVELNTMHEAGFTPERLSVGSLIKEARWPHSPFDPLPPAAASAEYWQCLFLYCLEDGKLASSLHSVSSTDATSIAGAASYVLQSASLYEQAAWISLDVYTPLSWDDDEGMKRLITVTREPASGHEFVRRLGEVTRPATVEVERPRITA